MPADKNKLTLYLDDDTVSEIKEASALLDRKHSWIFKKAWALAKDEILGAAGEKRSKSTETDDG